MKESLLGFSPVSGQNVTVQDDNNLVAELMVQCGAAQEEDENALEVARARMGNRLIEGLETYYKCERMLRACLKSRFW